MPNQFDHGIAAIRHESDGSSTVQVCAQIRAGRPDGVFAVHAHTRTVVVHPEVALRRTGPVDHTDAVVEVFAADDGAIHIRPVGLRVLD